MNFLIIDDSTFTQKITANLLKKYFSNSEMNYANNGREGLEKYRNIKPDYLFVDLLMPELSGKELVKIIKEDDPEAKIIVISADVQKSIKEEMEQYGVLAFINKPFNDEKAKYISDLIRNEIDEQ